ALSLALLSLPSPARRARHLGRDRRVRELLPVVRGRLAQRSPRGLGRRLDFETCESVRARLETGSVQGCAGGLTEHATGGVRTTPPVCVAVAVWSLCREQLAGAHRVLLG